MWQAAPAVTDLPETEQGKALYQELLFVHAVLRNDLATIQRIAADVAEGMSGKDVRAELLELKTNGPLWQLKVNCLRYCSFVHGHHGAEDDKLFPRLREAEPELSPVIDRLEADHRKVSDLLEEVEAAAEALTASEDARARVVATLSALAEHLFEHLEVEELQAGPALRRLKWFG